MPDMDGLTALPMLREAAPSTEVVVLTASEDEGNLLGAIRAALPGYLLKSEPPERIVAFLRGVAQGEAALSGAVARRLLDEVREGGGSDRRAGLRRARRCRRASSRCCSCSTGISAPTRSPRGSSSPSTRCART